MKPRKPNTKNTIYLLTNTANGKIYVGQTWYDLHIRMGKDGCNYKNSIHLYNAIKKYGADKFQYKVLVQVSCQTVADYMEDYYIELYNSRDPKIGYNIKTGGSVGRHSEETKAKISATLKEQASEWTPEELAERVAPVIGWWIGKKRGPQSEERKQANSEFMKKRHAEDGHPMQGEHHTDEARAKISKANTGKKRTPEMLVGISEAHKMPKEREQVIIQAYLSGKIISEIEKELNTKRSSIYRVLKRNNISRERDNGRTGSTHSDETKKKMSEARKEYWDDKHNSGNED